MISLNEDIWTFAEATRKIPKRRRGRKAATSTIYRWAKLGLKGVRLEVLQVGGTLCTSRQALERFFHRLTEVGRGPETVHSTPVDQKETEAIEHSLDELGV